MTAHAKTCEDPEEVHLDRVTQVTCQDACLEKSECLGISCTGYKYYDCSSSCQLCKNDNIIDGVLDKDAFHLRPGTHWELNLLEKFIAFLSFERNIRLHFITFDVFTDFCNAEVDCPDDKPICSKDMICVGKSSINKKWITRLIWNQIMIIVI